MKRFKLLKDLPTFKAGDEFYIDNFGSLRLCKSNIIAYSKHSLEKFPSILTDWFEEIPEKYERWRAKYGEEYWYASDGGCICRETEDGHSVDNHRFLTGNYFKTREEVETYREYLLARQVLIGDADGGKVINGEKSYYTRYYIPSCYMGMNWYANFDFYTYTPGVIYFKDKESLEKSLKEHKKQWGIVRKYEMGEM